MNMSLLIHVITSHFGDPDHRSLSGECYWTCIECGSGRWGTRPPRPGMKDRWRCWSCGSWGDERDFLRLVHPEWTGEEITNELDRLRTEYANGHEPSVIHAGALRGRERFDHRQVWDTYDQLNDFEQAILAEAHRITMEKPVALMLAVAEYSAALQANALRCEEGHLLECDEPGCKTTACRKARGEPVPKTARELLEGCKEAILMAARKRYERQKKIRILRLKRKFREARLGVSEEKE